MAIVRTVRKYWVFSVLLAVICGWLLLSGLFGLLNDVVTCPTWNVFVLDFSGYDLHPGETCATAKSGGGYEDVRFANNAIDWAKIGVGAVILWAGLGSLVGLSKKADDRETTDH